MKILKKITPVFCALAAFALVSCEEPQVVEEVDAMKDSANSHLDTAKDSVDESIDNAKDSVKDGIEAAKDVNNAIKKL